MPIRTPLSPGSGWIEASLWSPYGEYANLAQEHLTAGRYFDAIVVSCVGYDVLMNTLPDRIRLHHDNKLTPVQKKVIEDIEKAPLTAGAIFKKLKDANLLHSKLHRALAQFNKERNKVIHPIKRQKIVNPDGSTYFCLSLKPEAVVPHSATKRDADRYFRYFCRIIDLSGGESPRHNEEVSRARPSMDDMVKQAQKRWE